jgi:hypothetical protein
MAALLIAGAVIWVVWLFTLSPDRRSEALKLGGFIIPLVLAVITVVSTINRARRPGDPQPIDALVDSLALAVQNQWRKAANERSLLTPAPIQIRWTLSDLPIAGPVEASVGSPEVQAPFSPIPGCAVATLDDLRRGGGRREMHALYAGLGSGRVILTGAAGAGKTGAAILLLLDALSHRELVGEKERHRVPVPLLVHAVGWDPITFSVQEWLSKELTSAYPVLQQRGGRRDAMNLLMRQDKIALLLDGFDEMEESLRPAALLALADAPFRVVVFTRPLEMVDAASAAWLVGSAAIDLHKVTGRDAAYYLVRALRGPAPSGWSELLARLQDDRCGSLAVALSTPLMLTLVRDTYRAGDSVNDLLDMNRSGTVADIEHGLIARLLADAYSRRPGRPEPRYSLRQAQRGLTFFATQLNERQVRDLAWWHLPAWTPSTPRVLITVGFFAIDFGLVHGLLGVALSEEEFLTTFVPGAILGTALGAIFGIPFARGLGEPRRFRITALSAIITRSSIYRALAVGFLSGVAVGVIVGFLTWVAGSARVVEYGVTFGIPAGLAAGLFAVFASGKSAEGSPLSPYETWRNDRAIGIGIGLTVGAVTGTLVWLNAAFHSDSGPLVGLFGGFAFGLACLLGFGLTCSKTWPTGLAWLQLIVSRRVPAVGLMSYLEYARERGVLRTVGGLYQFRHSSLQDHLIEHGISAASRRPLAGSIEGGGLRSDYIRRQRGRPSPRA